MRLWMRWVTLAVDVWLWGGGLWAWESLERVSGGVASVSGVNGV